MMNITTNSETLLGTVVNHYNASNKELKNR